MRRRRNAAVLAVSLAAHAALLAAWMSTRQDLRWAEPPTMQVALVELPPPPKPPPEPREPRPSPTRVLARPAQGLEPRPVEQPPEPPPDNAPAQISPEWRVKPQPSLVLKPLSKTFRRPKCKSSEDHSGWDGPPCPPGSPDDQAARYDVKRDSKAGAFAGEGDRKLRTKSYRESPRTDDYPGIRCTILHKC
ncbi:MAG: hypothetical protein ACREE0_00280 [Phenylobacterium sp.]